MSDSRNSSAPDDERDAYLREALRHAPDADAAAPAALRDTILKQARAAVASATSLPQPAATRATAPRGAAAWSSLWAWLMRPPVAAGFASLMVATLVGVMWWGRPIDDPLREARAPAATPNPPSAPPATVAQAPAQPTPRGSTEADVAVAAAPKADADQRRAVVKEKAAKPTPAPRQSTNEVVIATKRPAPEPQAARGDSKMAAARPMPAPAVRDEAAQSTALAKARAPVAAPPEASVTRGASSESATATATGTATDTAAAAPLPATPATPAAVVAAGPRTERKSEAEPLNERSRLGARTQPAEAGAQQPGTQLAANARADSAPAQLRVATRSPASVLRAAVAADPAAWTWQRGNGPERAMNDAVQAWLGQLDEATHSRWQNVLSGTGAHSSDTRPLRLLRNGRVHSTVLIEPGAVRIEAAGDAALGAAGSTSSSASSPPRALLPAAAAAVLKTALDQAAP